MRQQICSEKGSKRMLRQETAVYEMKGKSKKRVDCNVHKLLARL